MLWCLFQESLKIVEYPLHQLICLGLLEIHVAPSNLGQQQCQITHSGLLCLGLLEIHVAPSNLGQQQCQITHSGLLCRHR